MALGAFLLGAIVADTPQRTQVDRTFEGLRDVFSAVFFVAIGMLIDVRSLFDVWGLVLAVAALALFGRSLACATGLLITGSPTVEAVRVGLLVVPAGADVLRFLAPYSVTKEEIQEALEKVRATL
ncbi:MAG TPA: hypothetical protein DEO44_06210 [Verrucomicrobia subdivision 6 bacterium]|nr:hypothetical protein [Verrucomicrobia subdivision 6 bacterium]